MGPDGDKREEGGAGRRRRDAASSPAAVARGRRQIPKARDGGGSRPHAAQDPPWMRRRGRPTRDPRVAGEEKGRTATAREEKGRTAASGRPARRRQGRPTDVVVVRTWEAHPAGKVEVGGGRRERRGKERKGKREEKEKGKEKRRKKEVKKLIFN